MIASHDRKLYKLVSVQYRRFADSTGQSLTLHFHKGHGTLQDIQRGRHQIEDPLFDNYTRYVDTISSANMHSMKDTTGAN
jgi:hypothetical protein